VDHSAGVLVEEEHTVELSGHRVLIVEDELMIALDTSATFSDAGAEIVGPYSTLSQALKAAKSQAFSIAILDVRLGRDTTEPVAAALAERGVPVIFCTGQSLSKDLIAPGLVSLVIEKPARQETILAAAKRLLGEVTVRS
jgi:DNA-binding response OmpR family regulator